MAIQFSCPSCRQPIEVDDNWADQAVACPYCRRVVTAPKQSSWPPPQIPVASPAARAVAPPPPPGQGASSLPAYPSDQSRAATGVSSAGWGLTLAIFSAVLSFVGAMIWSVGLYALAMDKVDQNAPPEQLQRAAQELMMSGAAPVSPGAVITLAVGIFCGIAALGLAVRSLVRNERQYVKAVAACVTAALFVVCQGLLVLVIFHRGAAV